MERPNILFILCDSWRAETAGCYGNPIAKTPNLDRLADDGVRFAHAYTVAPICHPARASIATGLFLHGHGVLTNVISEGTYPYKKFPSAPVMTRTLCDAGYNCGYSGQGQAFLTDGWADTRNGFTAQQEWLKTKGLNEFNDTIVKNLYGINDYDLEHTRDAFNTRGAMELMEKFSADDGPWFIHCDLDAPHAPIGIAPEFADMYNPRDIPRPANFDDPFDNKPDGQKLQRLRQFGKDGPSWERMSQMQAHYYAYVSQTDYFLGKLLDTLEETGQGDNTLVVFMSDHGEHIGNHGLLFKGQSMYDELMHVPLIARWPKCPPKGAVFDGFVSHVDLLSTFAQAAQTAQPENTHGKSWLNIVTGDGEYENRDSIYAQYCGTGASYYTMRMVRTHKYKYVYSHYAPSELYDLEKDPAEIVNLAGTTEAKGAECEMHNLLIEWARETSDPIAKELTPLEYD